MGKMTRMQKYAELREEIENNREKEIVSSNLATYANKLHNIDADEFDKMEVNDSKTPSRVKEININNNEETKEHDMLSEVLNEVKEYNYGKEDASCNDTQSHILSELRSKNNIRPFGNVENIPHNNETKTISEIKEDKEAIKIEPSHDDTTEIPFISSDDVNNTISFEIEKILNGETEDEPKRMEDYESSDEPDFVVSKETNEQLLNETRQIFISDLEETMKKETSEDSKDEETDETKETEIKDTDTYKMQNLEEDEDDEEESKLSANGILNFVLVLCILVMLVSLAVIVYFILLNKGII